MPASPSLTPSQEPPASSGHVARVSLRLRVLALVAAANVVVFGAGLAHLSTLLRDAEEQAEREYSVRGRYALESAINERGELRVAQILTWPFWGAFSDAVITDLHARGVSLNPVGSAQRDATFDREGIQRAIEDAVRRRESVPIAGGRAMAILDDRGRAWGGVWFRVGEAAGTSSLWTLLPWFFGSTLLLFGGTFWVLRRYVLQPVGELAEAAGRVRRGDLGVTVELPPHRDELTDLMDTFNHMTAEVKDFHDHLEVEAHEARRAAFAAEAAALRQRRLAAMGELAAGIAHEINNPLGGMLNAVDVLDREGLASEKRARYHELLRGGLQRIQATVAGLLRFTPRAAPHAPLDLAGPVQDAIALMHHGRARRASR
ncbi:MAG: HAMP domain-containing protein [Planctomycetes bacterium]|nr:HAMP domain-containing protein [Planctomycetota bacterium]